MLIEKVNKADKTVIDGIVNIHLKAFQGFFLTFLGKGFLKTMYSCYTAFENAELLVAKEGDALLGFVSYSTDMSELYKFMLKRKFFSFIWFAFLGFLKQPKAFLRLFRALNKSKEVARKEKYVEISSIGVDTDYKRMGVGSKLLEEVKKSVDY